MPDSDISISIINYRTADLTCACLKSICSDWVQSDNAPNLQIVVVDNASGDGSDRAIDQWIRENAGPVPIRLVRSTTNSGFAGGHNLGLASLQTGTGGWHLALNSDAVLLPGCLSALLKAAMAADASVGLISPTILNADGQPAASRFRNHTVLSEFVRAAGSAPVSRLFPRGRVAMQNALDPDWAQPDWISFAAVLMRHQMVAEIGPLDEGYFLYFEDAEYCLRAKRGGWQFGFAPEAEVAHEEGGSGELVGFKSAKKRLPAYFYASRSRFLYQAHGHFGLWSANLSWYLGRLVAQTRRLVGRSVPPASEHEARDLWINIFDPLGPRLAPWETRS